MPGLDDPLYFSEDRPDRPVSGGSWAAQGDVGTITVPRAAAAPAAATDPARSLHYFGPQRFGVRFGPPAFRDELHAIDPRLEVTWHPLAERWIIWAKNHDVTFWMHPGWSLLFPVQAHPSGAYLPLDARTLAKVYDRSPRQWGSGRAYFERIVEEIRRDTDRAQRARQQYVRDVAGDVVDHARIQVSMCGPSNGSKFANHHAE